MSEGPQKLVENSAEKEVKLKKFRGAVEKYLAWQNQTLSLNRPHLEEAEKRKGQNRIHNIYQTPDGKIWKLSPGGYTPFEEGGIEQKELPEGAVEGKDNDDWAWETIEAYNARDKYKFHQKKESDDEYNSFVRYEKETEQCAAFAHELLNNWDKIEAWAQSQIDQREIITHQHYEEVWQDFIEDLGLKANKLADPTEMKIRLSESLNELKTGKPSDLGISY